MRRILLALFLLFPVPLLAQEIATDTITVDIYGQTVIVAIDYVPPEDGAVAIGDTVTFTMAGSDEFGDPLAVSGEFVSLDTTLLQFVEQRGDTAVAVARGKGTVQVTATRIVYGTATSMSIGWLDEAGDWQSPPLPEMQVGDTLQLCAAIEYDSGLTAVGSTDSCLAAYNELVTETGTSVYLAKVVQAPRFLAFGG